MNTNRRHFSRIVFDAPCQLQQGDRQWQCDVLDISLNGLLVQMPEEFDGEPASPFEATVMLNSQGPRITMALELRHQEGNQLGFHCSFTDLDSVSHLRRLVELNLGDEQLLQRELNALSHPD
ncbi:MAG: PilZ domain-containing protein [Halomonadaceae bacterium]|nr:MAG: PilZ domain-containing protein [Halomonadaceae bacterium]